MSDLHEAWVKGDVAYVHTNSDYGSVGDIFTVGQDSPSTKDWLNKGGHGGHRPFGQVRKETCRKIGNNSADAYRNALKKMGELELQLRELRGVFQDVGK